MAAALWVLAALVQVLAAAAPAVRPGETLVTQALVGAGCVGALPVPAGPLPPQLVAFVHVHAAPVVLRSVSAENEIISGFAAVTVLTGHAVPKL